MQREIKSVCSYATWALKKIILPAVGENTLLICPIYCIFYNPPVSRGVGSCYVTLQHFSAAFDFTHSSIPLASRSSAPSSSLYPLRLALCVPHVCSLSWALSSHPQPLSVSLSLSLPPSFYRGFTPHCGHKSFTALLFLDFFSTASPLAPSFRRIAFIFPSLISIYPPVSPLFGSNVTRYRLYKFPPTIRGRTGQTVHPLAVFSHSFFFLPPSPAAILHLSLFITSS